MNPSTPHVEDSLLEFAYGELAEKDARAVEVHLESCAQCRAELEDIRRVRRVMSKLPEAPAPSAGLESLLAYAQQAARRTQAGPAPGPAWWRKWVMPLAGVSAAVAIGIVAQKAYEGRDLGQAVQLAASKKAEAELAAPAPTAAMQAEPEPAMKVARAPEGMAAASPARLAEQDDAPARERRPAALAQAGEAQGPALEEEARAERPKRKGLAAKDEAAFADRSADLIAHGVVGGTSGAGLSGFSRGGALGGLGAGASAPATGGKSDIGRAGPGASAQPLVVDKAQKPSAKKIEAARREADDDAFGEIALEEATAASPSPAAPRTAFRQDSATPRGAESVAGPSKNTMLAARDRSATAPPASAPMAASADDEDAERPARLETGARAAAPSPANADARVRQLLDAARAAQSQRRYDDAAAHLRTALALKVSDSRLRMEALSLACDVQYAIGNTSAAEAFCLQLASEFPNSGAAQVATRRIARERAAAAKAKPATTDQR